MPTLTWLRELLADELAPYPGRGDTVARMVIASVLTMLIVMTFRIPSAALGVFYVLVISRESPESTLRAGLNIVVAYMAGLAFLLVGLMLFVDVPLLHFLFITGAMFVMFFVIRTLSSYGASTGFAFLIVTSIPLWDRAYPAEAHLQSTLWATFSVVIGTAVTVAVEMVMHRGRPGEDIRANLMERIEAVHELLQAYPEPERVAAALRRLRALAMVGTARLRRTLARADWGETAGQQNRAEVATLITLVDQLVDITAHFHEPEAPLTGRDLRRLRRAAGGCASLARAVREGHPPVAVLRPAPLELSAALPLLSSLERVLTLVPDAATSHWSTATPGTAAQLFLDDAFTNGDHVRFALKGCLAGMICYLVYHAVAWPGLSAGMTTCIITALSTVGSSRQKQVLRILGAIAGGVVFGMGSQIFVLPHLDTITGLTLLFGAVTGLAAWIATSSPRLSYFGLQLALAFDLILFQTFTIDTMLSIGRDRVLGILLGLIVMWAVFDNLWARPAVEELRVSFAANLRRLAALARARDRRTVEALREGINQGFLHLHTQADSVSFEFGADREEHMAARARILAWQAAAASLFLTLLASAQAQPAGISGETTGALLEAAAARVEGREETPLGPWIERLREEAPAGGRVAAPLESKLVDTATALAAEIEDAYTFSGTT